MRLSFGDVIHIAETNPNQNIWCISMDGRVDFIMSADEIKKTVGNFDWEGVDFMLVENKEESAENPEPLQTHGNVINNGEFQIAPQRLKHRVRMFAGSELGIIENDVNNFIKNIGSAIEIEYSIARDGLNITYSVLIHYVEE